MSDSRDEFARAHIIVKKEGFVSDQTVTRIMKALIDAYDEV